jgi:hypothetical protein
VPFKEPVILALCCGDLVGIKQAEIQADGRQRRVHISGLRLCHVSAAMPVVDVRNLLRHAANAHRVGAADTAGGDRAVRRSQSRFPLGRLETPAVIKVLAALQTRRLSRVIEHPAAPSGTSRLKPIEQGTDREITGKRSLDRELEGHGPLLRVGKMMRVDGDLGQPAGAIANRQPDLPAHGRRSWSACSLSSIASRMVELSDRRSASACLRSSWSSGCGSQACTTVPLDAVSVVATGPSRVRRLLRVRLGGYCLAWSFYEAVIDKSYPRIRRELMPD